MKKYSGEGRYTYEYLRWLAISLSDRRRGWEKRGMPNNEKNAMHDNHLQCVHVMHLTRMINAALTMSKESETRPNLRKGRRLQILQRKALRRQKRQLPSILNATPPQRAIARRCCPTRETFNACGRSPWRPSEQERTQGALLLRAAGELRLLLLPPPGPRTSYHR